MKRWAYYNDIDPYVCQWVRNLIRAGHIMDGEVQCRDFRDIAPNELEPFIRVHMFCGIAGWDRALRLAGWPADREIWTGSAPCQPFSAAGRQGGFADERHLWPFFHHHIRVRRPAVVLGEQVGGPAGLAWLDLVCADLEAEGYAVGAADLPAACVGAPHIRQRLFFVARRELGDSRLAGGGWDGRALPRAHAAGWADGGEPDQPGVAGEPRALAHGGGARLEVEREQQARRQREAVERGGEAVRMADSGAPGWDAHVRAGQARDGAGQIEPDGRGGPGFWSDIEWLPCRDGKYRPTEPGLFPLAHGISNRVAQLRAVGNAIVPQVAAELIKAALDF